MRTSSLFWGGKLINSVQKMGKKGQTYTHEFLAFLAPHFLREILWSSNCSDTIEVLCPCSKGELDHLVKFLYDGKIQCHSQNNCIKILENLIKIFGFPENLNLSDLDQTLLNNQNGSQGEDIVGALNNNVTQNDTAETILLQNSNETLMKNETSFALTIQRYHL